MTTIDPDRLAALDGIRLKTGKHKNRVNGMCAMEAAAWLAGEPHSDQPACVDPVIATVVRTWQDRLNDEQRELLVKPLVPLLVGTRSTPAAQHARAIACADWAIRHVVPTWLRLTPSLVEHADALAALPELATVDALKDASKRVVSAAGAADRSAGAAARSAAWAARSAARSGARAADAAADAAAGAAAAAADAAADAAWAAARSAAESTAWAAAEAAACAADAAGAAWVAGEVRKAAHQLHADTVTLIHRLIDIKEQQ
jgi:hypothetical protein